MQAQKEIPMTMKDWVAHVDRILTATGEELLKDAGKITKKQMLKKVEKEYREYSNKTLTKVEQDYLEKIQNIENIAKSGKGKNE